jgi:hypothetical protein
MASAASLIAESNSLLSKAGCGMAGFGDRVLFFLVWYTWILRHRWYCIDIPQFVHHRNLLFRKPRCHCHLLFVTIVEVEYNDEISEIEFLDKYLSLSVMFHLIQIFGSPSIFQVPMYSNYSGNSFLAASIWSQCHVRLCSWQYQGFLRFPGLQVTIARLVHREFCFGWIVQTNVVWLGAPLDFIVLYLYKWMAIVSVVSRSVLYISYQNARVWLNEGIKPVKDNIASEG